MNNDTRLSSYLDHLPAMFRDERGQGFIGRFLLAFEAVLSGLPDARRPGLAETVERLSAYFDPQHTDEAFLPWLASWVALSLHADWETGTKREFIRQIVPLYHLRGTKAGLQRMLEIYTKEPVTIHDDFERPAHFFQVELRLSDSNPLRLRRKQQIARAIIEQEKPAHTFYALQIAVPTMRLVSVALQQREKRETGTKPRLLILSGETTEGNTILGTDTQRP